MFRSAFILVALVGYASAQLNQRGISGDCQNAVTTIVANSTAAECLGASSLVALSTSSTNSSVIPSINNWLTNICKAPKCSNATLVGIVQNITKGCATDLNITAPIATLTNTVEQFYPILRRILCLKDGSTNCITQVLENIQATYGQINVANLINLVRHVDASGFTPNITCTNCNKEIYNELNQSSTFLANNLGPVLKSQCGASYIDGKTPSGIIESASNSTETATPSSASSAAFGGFSLLSHGIFSGLSGLAIISAFFTLT